MKKISIQTLKMTATEDTQSNDSIGTEQRGRDCQRNWGTCTYSIFIEYFLYLGCYNGLESLLQILGTSW